MKQILLLTDFSDNSINAMRYALQLFKDFKGTFYVLHVESSKAYISDDLILGGSQSIYDSIIKKTKNQLSQLLGDLKSEFKDADYTLKPLVDYDGFTVAINQILISKSIDLIVMGSNGVTGAKETLFGSNTVNVIRNVNCTTLVIPEGYKYKKPSEVLVPLDLDETLSSNAFSDLIKFADRFCDKIHLLRLNLHNGNSKERQNDAEQLSTMAKDLKMVYHVIDNVPTEYAVSCYTQTHPIGLTALLVKKESFFERFFTGSATSKISNTLQVPLLVFHV